MLKYYAETLEFIQKAAQSRQTDFMRQNACTSSIMAEFELQIADCLYGIIQIAEILLLYLSGIAGCGN